MTHLQKDPYPSRMSFSMTGGAIWWFPPSAGCCMILKAESCTGSMEETPLDSSADSLPVKKAGCDGFCIREMFAASPGRFNCFPAYMRSDCHSVHSKC